MCSVFGALRLLANFAALFVFAGSIWVVGCSSKRVACVSEIRSEAFSPDGQHRAVVFFRKCGEDGPTTTHVSLLNKGEPLPNGNGNIMGFERPVAVRVAWANDSHLTIYSYANLSTATRLDHAGSVAIEYSQLLETDLVAPLPSPK
jgi:hypothetical protein